MLLLRFLLLTLLNTGFFMLLLRFLLLTLLNTGFLSNISLFPFIFNIMTLLDKFHFCFLAYSYNLFFILAIK